MPGQDVPGFSWPHGINRMIERLDPAFCDRMDGRRPVYRRL